MSGSRANADAGSSAPHGGGAVMSRMAAAQRMEAQEAARLERERRDAAAATEARASELNDENARPLPNIRILRRDASRKPSRWRAR